MTNYEFLGKIGCCVTLKDYRKDSCDISSPSDSEMRLQNEQCNQGFLLAPNLI